MASKALFIDAVNREIREVEYEVGGGVQKLVGGYIEVAYAPTLPAGDVLYADEEGLLKSPTHFFWIEGGVQPICGNGVVVGRERSDAEGGFVGTHPPTITADQLRAKVRFADARQTLAWAKANASEPASVLHSERGSTVLTTFGQMFADALPPPIKRPTEG